MDPSRYIPDIWALDYFVAFVYIVIILLFALTYKKIQAERGNNHDYLMKALFVKIFGGLGFLMLTVYYWGGGDTYSYWNTANDFTSLAFSDPLEGIRIMFTSHKNMNWYLYDFAYNRHHFLSSSDTFTTVKITAILNMLSFRSYVVTTVLFSTLSFLGVYNMYFMFCKVYPHLRRQLFYGFFYIPSVILWGSGILKDTITIACVGWMVYSFMNLVLFKRKKSLSIFIIIVATITTFYLKPYILYILYPSLLIWVQSNIKEIIKNNLIRKILAPFIATTLILGTGMFIRNLSADAGRYKLDQIQRTLEGFQSWHTTVSSTQSGYSLGEMDFSTFGIIKKIPASIEVTFFRPYIWEVYNASTLLAAIEGTILILIVAWLFLKYRLRLFRLIYRNKDVLFLMVFSILFGIVVGLSSYNFGALSRYKIPAQMFFVVALILLIDKTEDRYLLNRR